MIGKNIKKIRQSKAMTQEALAEALFVTRQTVSNYENGRSQPDLDTLLRIAEILGTDINSIIYGPPMLQSKKESYRWLWTSFGVLAVQAALYIIPQIYFSKKLTYGGEFYAARMILQLTLRPAVMFLLGWVLTHGLSVISNLQQLHFKRIKVLRVIVIILLCVIAAIPIPYVVYFGIAGYTSWVYRNVSMSFPDIPIYQEAFVAVYYVISHMPFAYSIFGSVCWLLGLPRVNKNKQPI